MADLKRWRSGCSIEDGDAETLYRLDLGSTQRALRWRGAADRPFGRQGTDQQVRTPPPAAHGGGRALFETNSSASSQISIFAPWPQSMRQQAGTGDALDYLGGEMDRRAIIKGDSAVTEDVKLRLNCMVTWDPEFVEVQDVGFRDCWLAAFAAYRSSHIALRNSVIEGSTYALAAIGGEQSAGTAHSFEIIGNLWKQSPSAYISRNSSCEIQSDWDCPVSIWNQVPWGVTHHFFWGSLNGALFGSKDIAGNVKISGNHVIDAYNGVRARLNATCLADPACRARVNVGFEITDNVFERIRDNPIEPEGHAAYWIVKHNTFVDVHAAISTDGLAGHDLLVFGNLFVLRARAGVECAEGTWLGSRQFRPSLGGGGRWSSEGALGDEAQCSAHSLGTIIKLGGGRNLEAPLLDRILFFNNSLQTRSPLFRASPAPPITSYNNAVQFTGCGKDDPRPCRQDPDPDPSCTGEEFWTTDRQAIVADCFPLRDSKGKPIPHRMRHNAYNRAPDWKLNFFGPRHRPSPVRRDGHRSTSQQGGRRGHLCCSGKQQFGKGRVRVALRRRGRRMYRQTGPGRCGTFRRQALRSCAPIQLSVYRDRQRGAEVISSGKRGSLGPRSPARSWCEHPANAARRLWGLLWGLCAPKGAVRCRSVRQPVLPELVKRQERRRYRRHLAAARLRGAETERVLAHDPLELGMTSSF